MLSNLRVALAAAAVAALPQLAHAGPIRWGYKAESPDGTVLREVRGLTDLYHADLFLPSAQFSGESVPDPIPDNGVVSIIRRSRANVTIFDEPSGESGTFELYYDYLQQFEQRPDGTLDPIYEGNGSQSPDFLNPVQLTLGGNGYTIRSLGGDMMVTVTPGAPVATPEPTTLALAGLGLGALGLGRLRARVRTP